MGSQPTNMTTVQAICALLPDDAERAASLVAVACAAVAIRAKHDDETAVRGLRAALNSLRETGFGEDIH